MAKDIARRGRLAFVTPRYGEGVVGGSEAVMREAARGFAARGYEVDVLTTCARDHYTWANEFPAGMSADGAVTLRRFRTAAADSPRSSAQLERRVISGSPLTHEQELSWVNGRFRVPDLYFWLRANAGSYDAIIFSPYLFWTTLYCAPIAPERTVLLPCLHDEPYAYLGIVGDTLASSASVWFLSEPEHQLGHRVARLPPHHAVVGAAVEVPTSYSPADFRERFEIERPFVLYAGRREGAKGWQRLVNAFGAALLRHDLPFDLVTVGVGSPEVPKGLEDRVRDLGYLASEDVPNAFAAAEAFIQPSTNESFSRTLMEAWLAGTPVIANGRSEVVAWHCERSGGGLTYDDDFELGQCLNFVADAPKAAAELAHRGREYVLEHYTWDIVLDAMELALEPLL